ncbi:hypothetical protein BDN70DRAFT_901781 [Pholiota conissans]|uniref:Uncharacterized protein n=1 Tax=Pholiota conissans TaxID=109636 RepID=A0A9P5YJ87_9AGAR|nr:hypothetical protein BDN70DRAFT_901781 [Pholiota conissans]
MSWLYSIVYWTLGYVQQPVVPSASVSLQLVIGVLNSASSSTTYLAVIEGDDSTQGHRIALPFHTTVKYKYFIKPQTILRPSTSTPVNFQNRHTMHGERDGNTVQLLHHKHWKERKCRNSVVKSEHSGNLMLILPQSRNPWSIMDPIEVEVTTSEM